MDLSERSRDPLIRIYLILNLSQENSLSFLYTYLSIIRLIVISHY